MAHRRHRRRYSAYSEPNRSTLSVLKPVMTLVIVAVLIFLLGSWILRLFGVGNATVQMGTILRVEPGSVVSVSIGGSDSVNGIDGQKIYHGDYIETTASQYAHLEFFDGSIVRLNENTTVILTRSERGQKESSISLRLTSGSLWTETGDRETYSGSIVRTIDTPSLRLTLPAETESVIGPRSIVVYESQGIGVTLTPRDVRVPIVIGEGQRFTLPGSVTEDTDLYAYRSALDPLAISAPFVDQSRQIAGGESVTDTPPESAQPEATVSEDTTRTSETLLVSAPDNDATVDGASVDVEGQIGPSVAMVRVNGYNATVDEQKGTFAIAMTLPDRDDVLITITALDEEGITLAETKRRITRTRVPPGVPEVLEPVKTSETYETDEERVVISGTAPKGAVGIIVNEYRLQLYDPAKGEWSYIASTKINNYRPGENVYSVKAINRAGVESEPATITIVLGGDSEETGETEGREGGDTSTGTPDTSEDTTPILNNDPLTPGTLSVILPEAGSSYEASESSFVIEGNAPRGTHTMWVNGYKLSLYQAGNNRWRYIADTKRNTLSRGLNEYEIVARNDAGKVLDKMVYTVTFRPGRR